MLLRIFFIFISLMRFISSYAEEQAEASKQEANCLVLDLPHALSRALNFNRQLLGTIESLTKAQYGVSLAESEFDVQIVPNSRVGYVGGGHAGTGMAVGGGVDFSKKFTNGTQISLEPGIIKNPDHYHTELRALVTQPLLRGLGRAYQLANVLGSQFVLRTAYRNLYTAQVQLMIRTIQALYEVVRADKSMCLHQESYERVRQFYQAAKLKEKIALADALDVYRAEIELQHAEDALKNAQEKLLETEDIVRELLALPLDQRIVVELPLIYTPLALSLEEVIELALQNRIEIDQAQDQSRENRRLSSLAKQNLYPELNLVFNYSNCGRDEIFTRACSWRHRESKWGVGFTTSTNFDPAAERVLYEQSLMAIAAAERGEDQTKATLILEAKKTVRQLERAYQRIHLQEEQIKTTKGELYLSQVKFNHSMADNFNVLQAEKSLRGAEQAYWSALIEHIVGEFQLLATVGLLIEKPRIP